MVAETYKKENDKKNIEKTEKILSSLPSFIRDYFVSRRSNTSTKTRLAYAYDLRGFFSWLKETTPEFLNKEIKEITIEEFGKIKARDIEDYIFFLQSKPENANANVSIARKLACLSSVFGYFSTHDVIPKNPCDAVTPPKIHDIEIITLTPVEIGTLLNVIEFGSNQFSEKQENYLKKTRFRDLTIVILMLTTGIRVSECVSLDISSIRLDECLVSVIRKGGNVASVALSDEAIEILTDYLNWRKSVNTTESALFLSIQGKRMCVQSIEDMLKKYVKAAGIDKPITPHKLRKTFGTQLYRETGDIYLVASSLGHSSPTTTARSYAKQSTDNLLNARNKVKLK